MQLIKTDLLGCVVHLSREEMRAMMWALEHTESLYPLTEDEQKIYEQLKRWYHLSVE